MASVHRDSKGESRFWQAAFTDGDGRRRLRSTKTTDRKQAFQIAEAWEHGARLKSAGKLNPDTARSVIGEGLARMFAADSGALPSSTVAEFCERWVASKRKEVSRTSFVRYQGIIRQFITFMGTDAKRDISAIEADTVTKFRDHLAEKLSFNSAVLSLKVLRSIFGDAQRQRLVTQNVAKLVRQLKNREESRRRPFTLAEIKRILETAQSSAWKDSDWRGLIICGVYLGARLGDLARLTWRQVDLQRKELSLTTRKTGRRQIIPIAKPLQRFFLKLPSSDDPDAYIFPESCKKAQKHTGTLSNEFFELLVDTGLATKRENESTGKGRSAPRPVSPLTFHSLRHSTTTFLKAAGASDVMAREIIGHDSPEVSKAYTHLDTEDLREAVNALPDVTAKDGGKK